MFETFDVLNKKQPLWFIQNRSSEKAELSVFTVIQHIQKMQ